MHPSEGAVLVYVKIAETGYRYTQLHQTLYGNKDYSDLARVTTPFSRTECGDEKQEIETRLHHEGYHDGDNQHGGSVWSVYSHRHSRP